MNKIKMIMLACAVTMFTASAFAVEDGLGTNHVRNLRAIEDIIVEGGDVTIGKGDTAKAGALKLHDADAGDSFSVTVQANADIGSNFTLTLPANAGSNGQMLQTDGSGNLTWGTASDTAATKALDNLAAVAINADLDPGQMTPSTWAMQRMNSKTSGLTAQPTLTRWISMQVPLTVLRLVQIPWRQKSMWTT